MSASDGFHDPLEKGFGPGLNGRVLFWLAVAFSAFQIATAAHLIDLPSQVTRAIHVGFVCLLLFPLLCVGRKTEVIVFGWIAGLLGMAVGLYQWVEYAPLILRAGDPNELDLWAGSIALIILFIGAWRLMGPALPILSGLFLAYCFFGHLLPRPLDHRGYDFAQVIEHMSFGTEGIYGIPTFVSSTYIFLFILFGAFLERAGMIKLFTDVSMGLVGHARGGPAKVAVVSSALMGTISGSGVANVVTTGQFTIPLMKRFGYKPAFAGGVEATASMGGQIMPPVMGAVAFIMAETLDISYAAVVKAAIIPAILYFASALWMVHLEAGRLKLTGLPRAELPSVMGALRSGWYLILPLAALVWLLFSGYTPLFAGTLGLALTMMLILGSSVVMGLRGQALRVLFWIGLGLIAASFFRYGVTPVALSITALIAVNALTQGGRATLAACRDSLAEGARTALPVAAACAIVGVIIGTMTLTGAATTLGQFIVSVGRDSLLLSLVLTMLICLVLGMGVPTIPNYIITSSLAGPALLELGVPLIVSHMFVFYFGIMADLTPPVALAAFAAAPIARESGLKIGMQAIRIAFAGFVVPYIAVYSPALMLQSDDPFAIVEVILRAVVAIGLWGAGTIGFLFGPLRVHERLLALVAALLLIAHLPGTDAAGFALAALIVGLHWWRVRQV